MRFHSGSGDYVGLLCLNPSKSGGESMVTSSRSVYKRMLERRPELVKACDIAVGSASVAARRRPSGQARALVTAEDHRALVRCDEIGWRM